jgi:N-acetylglucosamine-6-phosphate deacetylase
MADSNLIGRIVTCEGLITQGFFTVHDGRIGGTAATATDGQGNGATTIMPGFIDIHNHGAVGVDVNVADVDGLVKVAEFLARNGVTSWMPTLVPDSDENYARAIDTLNELMRLQIDKPIAQAVGVHYEGVFANEAMCGALRPQYFKSGRWAMGSGVRSRHVSKGSTQNSLNAEPLFTRGLPTLDHGVHMTTLAPEIDGGIELIEELVADGWVVAIGHTRADAETLERAFEAGARHLTHFFNAMTGVHHRELGVAGWGLVKDGVTFDIIADGIHVAPEMLEMACRAKSPDKVSLISDSVAPTGLGDGEYDLWGERVSVTSGRTRNARGSIAGSVITLHDAVKRMLSLGFAEVEVAKMASTNPARLLGLDDRGSIEVGKRADLVALNADGSIAFTTIGGEVAEARA